MTSRDSIFECMTLPELEKWAIEASMDRNDNNVRVVAAELQIGKTTIYRKLHEYGIRHRKRLT